MPARFPFFSQCNLIEPQMSADKRGLRKERADCFFKCLSVFAFLHSAFICGSMRLRREEFKNSLG